MKFGKREPVDTGPSAGLIAVIIIVFVFTIGYFAVNRTPKQTAAQTPPAAVVDTTTKP